MTDYPLVSIQVATLLRVQGNGEPWKIRLELTGYNPEVKGKQSNKFWEMYQYNTGNTFINYGKIGYDGLASHLIKDFHEACVVAHHKLQRGYGYVAGTDFTKPEKKAVLTGPLIGIDRVELYKAADPIQGVPAQFRAVDVNGNLIILLDEQGVKALFKISPSVMSNSSFPIRMLA